MIPTIGAAVVYVSETGEVAAEITGIGADGHCHLTVTMVPPANVEAEQVALAERIASGEADASEQIIEAHTVTGARYSESGAVGTWHWPGG